MSRQARKNVLTDEREASDFEPLFIIGTGRCGSTLFHDLLARHPRVSYLSPLANQYPTHPGFNRSLLAGVDVPGAGWALRRRWHPVEAYRFWDHYYHGFSKPFRDLTAEDTLPVVTRRLRPALQRFASHRRPHLLCKITGWPRIGFLQAIYPKARFINVIRDGRATVNSLLQVEWRWDGWQGPTHWNWGPLSPDQQARWEAYDRSYVALAALQWEILMQAYEQAKSVMSSPERLLEIRYEDLCADPVRTVKLATDFAGLDFSGQFRREIEQFRVRDQNDKWKRDLSPSQQAVLTNCIRDALLHWGYEPDDSVPARRPATEAVPPAVGVTTPVALSA